MKRLIALAILAGVAVGSWLYLALRDSSNVWVRMWPDRVPRSEHYFDHPYGRSTL